MIFLGLKGFGDLTILISYLIKIDERHSIIIRKDLYELVKIFVGERHEIIILNTLSDVLPLYDLRNLNIKKIKNLITTYLELRSILKRSDQSLILDIKSLRNNFYFNYKKPEYLPIHKNIYDAYDDLFKTTHSNLEATNSSGKIIVFPFGSLKSKNASLESLTKIIEDHELNQEKVFVCSFFTDQIKLNNFNNFKTLTYKSINELILLMKESDIVISVDTFQLHLAFLLRIKIIRLGKINPYFNPPSTVCELKYQ